MYAVTSRLIFRHVGLLVIKCAHVYPIHAPVSSPSPKTSTMSGLPSRTAWHVPPIPKRGKVPAHKRTDVHTSPNQRATHGALSRTVTCTLLCLSSCSASMHRPLYLYPIKLHFSRTIHLWLDPCHVYPHTAHVDHHARVHAHQLQYGPILVCPLSYPLPLTHTPTALLLRGAGQTNTRPPVCRTHPTATQPRTHTDT
jgi:hypothetical protein